MWCGNCKETWNWREEETKSGRAERIKYNICGSKDTVIRRKIESFIIH